MKRLIFMCALFAFLLSGCSGWTVEPLPYISPTPFPSSTPIILSPTPIILPLPVTATADATPAALTDTPTTPTGADTQVVTETMTFTPSYDLHAHDHFNAIRRGQCGNSQLQ